MSQRIQTAAFEAVSRKSGIVALVLGSFLCNLAKMPLVMLKAGGLLSLLVALCMLLVADRAVRLAGDKPPGPGPDRRAGPASVARALREAYHRHAFLYAVAAAAFFCLHLAALQHLRMFPVLR